MPNEVFSSYALTLLTNLVSQGAQLVVFQNRERLDIVNTDITYLNVLAEGIVQLLRLLTVARPDGVNLNIIAARRIKVTQKEQTGNIEIIGKEDYIERIRERILLRMARVPLGERRNMTWTLTLESARKDERLMLADAVCHSWLTRKARFSSDQRTILTKLYTSQYQFTVVENGVWQNVLDHLTEDALALAIFNWYGGNHVTLANMEERFQTIILQKIKDYSDSERQMQYGFLVSLINNLMTVDRDLNLTEKILTQLQAKLLPKIREIGFEHRKFAFDISFLLVVSATHRGDITATERYINECRQDLHHLSARWETLDYYIKFKIREGVHLINVFDFLGAITAMDRLERLFQETIGLFHLTDELAGVGDSLRSDNWGKAIGTRLQAKIMLIRKDTGLIDSARSDSDGAILHFANEQDKKRQYQYRSQLECEAGEFAASFEWLAKTFVKTDNPTIEEVLQGILFSNKVDKVFGCMHYARLMAEAALSNTHSELGDKMFEAWDKLNVEAALELRKPIPEHPYEVILWKVATVLVKRGKIQEAAKLYERAYQICQVFPQRATLHAIGLGILAEKASLLSGRGKTSNEAGRIAVERLSQAYQRFMETDLPEVMRAYFSGWKNQLDNFATVPQKQQVDILWQLSREIPY